MRYTEYRSVGARNAYTGYRMIKADLARAKARTARGSNNRRYYHRLALRWLGKIPPITLCGMRWMDLGDPGSRLIRIGAGE